MNMKRKKQKPAKKLPNRLILLSYFTYNAEKGTLHKKATGNQVGWQDKRGYWSCRFQNIVYKVHRIVYKMFHGRDPGDKVIDHRDGDPSNNRIDNLRCVSRSANSKNTSKQREKTGEAPNDSAYVQAAKKLLFSPPVDEPPEFDAITGW